MLASRFNSSKVVTRPLIRSLERQLQSSRRKFSQNAAPTQSSAGSTVASDTKSAIPPSQPTSSAPHDQFISHSPFTSPFSLFETMERDMDRLYSEHFRQFDRLWGNHNHNNLLQQTQHPPKAHNIRIPEEPIVPVGKSGGKAVPEPSTQPQGTNTASHEGAAATTAADAQKTAKATSEPASSTPVTHDSSTATAAASSTVENTAQSKATSAVNSTVSAQANGAAAQEGANASKTAAPTLKEPKWGMTRSYTSSYVLDGQGNGQFNVITGSGSHDAPMTYSLKRGVLRNGEPQQLHEIKTKSLDEIDWKDFYRVEKQALEQPSRQQVCGQSGAAATRGKEELNSITAQQQQLQLQQQQQQAAAAAAARQQASREELYKRDMALAEAELRRKYFGNQQQQTAASQHHQTPQQHVPSPQDFYGGNKKQWKKFLHQQQPQHHHQPQQQQFWDPFDQLVFASENPFFFQQPRGRRNHRFFNDNAYLWM